jgi:hypothetical protein
MGLKGWNGTPSPADCGALDCERGWAARAVQGLQQSSAHETWLQCESLKRPHSRTGGTISPGGTCATVPQLGLPSPSPIRHGAVLCPALPCPALPRPAPPCFVQRCRLPLHGCGVMHLCELC